MSHFAQAESQIMRDLKNDPHDLSAVFRELRQLEHEEHNPKEFKNDLARLNKELHAKGLLPHLDIVADSHLPNGFKLEPPSTSSAPPPSSDSSTPPPPSEAPWNSPGGSSGSSGSPGTGGDTGGGAAPPGGDTGSGGGGTGGSGGTGSGGISDSSASVPNLPDVSNGNPNAATGNPLLDQSQQAFVAELAKKTGLNANVLAAEVYNEENGSAAAGYQAAHNNDWLNIGYTDSGQRGTGDKMWYSGPKVAADATAAWLKGQLNVPGFGYASQGIQNILRTVGKSPGEQIHAIQTSGWASSGYPDLPNIYNNIVAHDKPAPAPAPAPANLPPAKLTHT